MNITLFNIESKYILKKGVIICFSASASFTASALLTIIGIISVKKARTRAQRLLAYTPLFFAIQQCAEGILWLELAKESATPLGQWAMYTFLLFAFIFWPIWIPLTSSLVEKNNSRKHILQILLLVGVITATLIVWYIPIDSLSAEILCNHIYYDFQIPDSTIINNLLIALYVIAVTVPLLISTTAYLWVLGSIIALAFAISYLLYRMVFVSVWCFFAALISSLIAYSIYQSPDEN